MKNVLIFGGNGFIGRKFRQRIPQAASTTADISDAVQIRTTLDIIKPSYVINCAGKTGRPNVDWCEDHPVQVAKANVTGPVILGRLCREKKIHMTHIGSGCIYEGTNFSKGYREEDAPNFYGSLYSRSKIEAEQKLDDLEGPILQLRLRMPFDKEPGERNLVTKLVNYKRIINEQNSVSVIDDFIDASMQLIEKQAIGIYNVTNPGVVTHSEILDLYKQIVDPQFEYEIMPTSELKTKAGRSNCVLNIDKLFSEGIVMPEVHSSIRNALEHYKKCLKTESPAHNL